VGISYSKKNKWSLFHDVNPFKSIRSVVVSDMRLGEVLSNIHPKIGICFGLPVLSSRYARHRCVKRENSMSTSLPDSDAIWTVIPRLQPECASCCVGFLRYRPASLRIPPELATTRTRLMTWRAMCGNSHARVRVSAKQPFDCQRDEAPHPLHVYAEPLLATAYHHATDNRTEQSRTFVPYKARIAALVPGIICEHRCRKWQHADS